MLSYWFIFCILGLAAPLISKVFWNRDVSLKEIIIIGVSNSFILGIVFAVASYQNTLDTEIHNGYVISKSRDKVSCSHSYQCHCIQVSCGKDCTTEICQTCYSHPNDWNYNVKTSIGNLKIDRIDSQGKNIPPRFNAVKINEPVSLERTFQNYIKGSERTLFKEHINSDIKVQQYPRTYDYYRINRVINASNISININLINNELNNALRELGAKQKMNIIVYFWNHENDDYDRIVESKWLGGKKNDLIVMINVQGSDIKRVHTFGFSENAEVYYKVNRLVQEVNTINEEEIVKAILEGSKSFKKKSMQDYAYLKDEVHPSIWLILFAMFLSIGISSFLSYKAVKEEW